MRLAVVGFALVANSETHVFVRAAIDPVLNTLRHDVDGPSVGCGLDCCCFPAPRWQINVIAKFVARRTIGERADSAEMRFGGDSVGQERDVGVKTAERNKGGEATPTTSAAFEIRVFKIQWVMTEGIRVAIRLPRSPVRR